ncbi:hypothetical protein MnTg02_00035 [bacterium MnTg02]|nr:hypothetical protein MnTg02_00035 [bacterium MnTg02]
MIGGLPKTASRLAIIAATGIFMGGFALTPANAADLGGDCCADLEERVAELEATTARKGNNKVSLTVSGQVNRMITFWDDGQDDDIYIVDNNNSSTRLRFSGSAKINSTLEAGFKIEFDPEIDSSQRADADSGKSSLTIDMRIQDVWLKGSFGKVSLGKGDTASNGSSEVDLSGTSVAQYSGGHTDWSSAFEWIGSVPGITHGDTYNQFDGLSRRSRIRYDSPTLGGFTASTSFGQNDGRDDFWDVALRYAGEFGSIRVAAAIAYENDEDSTGLVDPETETVNGSISVMHVPTGLNVTFAAGERDFADAVEDGQFYYVKVGIKQKWFASGATAIAVSYYKGEDINTDADFINDETETWSVAVVHNIDAAAMEIYAAWDHAEYEEPGESFEDFDIFGVGARIKF